MTIVKTEGFYYAFRVLHDCVGSVTRQREIDTIGNNLANLQTPGYRSDRIVTSAFELGLLKQQEGGAERTLSEGGSPVTIVGDSVTRNDRR